jgi:hypothetical protein
MQEQDYNSYILAECYDTELDKDTFPLTFRHLCTQQRKDEHLMKKLEQGSYQSQSFHGGE